MKTKQLILCCALAAGLGRAALADTPPKFDEIYQLIRTNLEGVDQAELNHAAVQGLLEQLKGEVSLVGADSNSPAAAASGGVRKSAVYDSGYAYVRLGKIESGAADKFRAAFKHLVDTNQSKIRGLVLDLRFAGGDDYAAAGAVADCFLNSDQPLLQWASGSIHATTKTNAITLPVAILVNGQTSGAAEALAAALREENIGLILGSPTAGQANVFKEFSLSNGEKLRVATAQIKTGNGKTLAHGLKPDIAVKTSLADDKAHFDNPYKMAALPAGSTNSSGTNLVAQPPHRTINEAELVRERKAGENPDDASDDTVDATAAPQRPVMTDITLARAIDLLKGLAVLQQNRPG